LGSPSLQDRDPLPRDPIDEKIMFETRVRVRVRIRVRVRVRV
jgi:hypothetical protein